MELMRLRLARLVVGFVFVWPAVAWGLSQGWGVSPWKLMSFGMYSAPSQQVSVALLDADGRPVEAPGLDLRRLATDRRILGRLASADRLLAHAPPTVVTVRVRHAGLTTRGTWEELLCEDYRRSERRWRPCLAQ